MGSRNEHDNVHYQKTDIYVIDIQLCLQFRVISGLYLMNIYYENQGLKIQNNSSCRLPFFENFQKGRRQVKLAHS